MPGIDLAEFAERIRTLNAPEQGMNYRGAHSGERRYNEFDGKEYYTRGEPATLTVYGDRAQLLYDLIRNCAEISDALSTPVAQGDERRMLLDLLATIHRDGGQHVDSVGIEQATADAISLSAERIAQGDEVREAMRTLRYIVPYLDWTIGSESPGYHPTMPSAVAEFKTALATLTKGARDAG